MSPLQVRTIARASVSSTAASRLELLEYYLAHHEDMLGCAQASVDWLVQYAGVKQSVCLAVEAESNMLVGIAGAGVERDDVELFSWPLSDARDPLVAALAAAQPIVFRQARANGHPLPTTPLGAGAFTAVPLRGIRHLEESALGLLLVRSGNGLNSDVAWLVTVLGQKIQQVRGRGASRRKSRSCVVSARSSSRSSIP